MNPYYAIVYVIIQVLIATFSAAVSAIVAYGAIASAVVGLLGPVFIPFLVFDKLEFLFWGWLRAFIGFCFYKVLAAAVLSILAHLLWRSITRSWSTSPIPATWCRTLPLLILLVLVNIYILFKIPAMTMSIFSGSYRRPRRRNGRDDHSGNSQGDLSRRHSFMSSSTKPSPEITRAAERYLEQYGDPLVMNTYLKVTVLVLAGVCIALSALTFKSQQALANMHPMIVRINDVGHAEAIDYRNFQYRPQEAENKYYLTRWAELYFSRNRFTIERDQTQSLYFLNSDVQRAVIDQERKDNSIQNYVKDSSLPYIDVEIKNVILDDLRQSPYSARIEFEKVYTNPADHSELKRERWTASVTYVFRENVKNNELAVNPLGLTIVRFRADQAFS